MKQWRLTEPYLAIGGHLLEGPHYDPHAHEARFIDITGQLLYTFNTIEGPKSLKVTKTHDTIGVTATIQDSETFLIVAAKYGFAKLTQNTGEVSYVCEIGSDDRAKQKRMRFNDGAVDSRGRLWAGTMNDPEIKAKPDAEGALYRLNGDFTVDRMLDNVYTPNGIAWNTTNDKMFWTDSEPQNIYVFDFDSEAGTISNQKVFYHFEFGPGINPDGLAIDSEDCIWTCVWGGGKVLRISPEGVIIGEILLPTAFVTAPVFIGSELLITTCEDTRVTMNTAARGGDVYKVDVQVTGPAQHKFRILDR